MKGHEKNLAEAKKDLDKAKEEVQAAEEQQEHAERNMKICALTMLIPVVGTIPGGIALICNAVDYDNAVDKEKAARNMVSEHKTTISDHKRRIEACSREIRQKQDDIAETEEKLEGVNEELEMTRRAIKEQTEESTRLHHISE
ncbi:hypothetical protein AOXY_G28557 [Acipenser oxyrinchus oxyrinchus]|uniref:Uncharacterized protein n=1 Tax=Acipenser oxyrinchus oxyrinchus TaxID=40147 RepID=A0AAD8CQ88_ACIOX|nr:hypothetical protein AOXY_G28557 [Acipenser oxyrinchus oxyrinchus]